MAKRRHRNGGRTTPKGTRPGEPRSPSDTGPSQIEVLIRAADHAVDHITEINEAEAWASAIQETFRPVGIPRRPQTSVKAALREARSEGGAAGLALASAIAAYGPRSSRAQAEKVCEHLTAAGTDAPDWAAGLGQVEPTRVLMLSDIWGDGCSIHLDCERDGQSTGVGLLIDAIGGLIAHGFVYGPTSADLERFVADDPDTVLTEIDPADARATVEAGLVIADQTADFRDEESEDQDPQLRAMIEQRFSLLPPGGTPLRQIDDLGDDRLDLITRFLSRPGAAELPDIEDLADTFCNFADYCDGDPLCWSPARVETFLVVWVPVKVLADQQWYSNLPAALREWLRFAAAERGLPDSALEKSLAAIDPAMALMQENRLDPDKASPGSRIMSEMIADGIDPTDKAATQAWIDRYNASRHHERQ